MRAAQKITNPGGPRSRSTSGGRPLNAAADRHSARTATVERRSRTVERKNRSRTVISVWALKHRYSSDSGPHTKSPTRADLGPAERLVEDLFRPRRIGIAHELELVA